MRIDRHLFNWGIFFIFLGLIPLAVQQGVVGAGIASEAWRLWPLFLVVLGISIVLSRTAARFMTGALFAACFGLILGGAVAALPGWGGCQPSGDGAFQSQSGTLAGTASVDLEISCGRLEVNTTTGAQWTASWDGSGATPAISSQTDSVSMRTDTAGGLWFDRHAGNWRLALPIGSPVRLSNTVNGGESRLNLSGLSVPSASMTVNAGSLHADFGGATVGSVSVTVNAGSAGLILDSSSDVQLNASTNLGSLDVCAPADLAIEVRLKETLGGNNLGAAGFSRNGDTWTSPGATGKAHRATLDVTTNLGSLNVNPAGGCR